MARAVGDKRQSPTQSYSCRAHVIALTSGAETKFPSCSMTGTAIAEAAKMLAQTDAIPLSVVGEPCDPAVAHWMAVACCPSCGSTTRMAEAILPDGLYAFGTERVAFPEQGVKVIECGGCGLLYKSMVPTPAYLADMIRRQGETKWTAPHDFRLEVMILKLLNQGKTFDLLANGGLLGIGLWMYGLARAARVAHANVLHPKLLDRSWAPHVHTLAAMSAAGVVTYAFNPILLQPSPAYLLWTSFGMLVGFCPSCGSHQETDQRVAAGGFRSPRSSADASRPRSAGPRRT